MAMVVFIGLPADSILVLMGAGLKVGFRGWYLWIAIGGAVLFILYFILSRRLVKKWKM